MQNRKLIILCSLFFIADSGLVVNEVLTENLHDNTPPCADSGEDTKTATTQPPTQEVTGCPDSDLVPFKRKNGWWCVAATIYDLTGGTLGAPMGKTFASNNCKLNNLTLSSLETDEEWEYWNAYLLRIGYVSGVWAAIGRNETTGEYYWNDGQAVPKIKYGPITTVLNNGQVAWVVDKNSTTVPFGHLDVVAPNGENNPVINMGVCGVAGRQFVENIRNDSEPCEENGESKPPTTTATTTKRPPNTSDDPGCPKSYLKPFKRKNGWWCGAATIFDLGGGLAKSPMGKTFALNNCILNNYTLSSLETDEEWEFWMAYVLDIGYISGVWAAIGRNETTGEHYWNDGQAVPEMKYGPITTVVKGGEVAWVVDKNSTTAPFGHLDVVAPNGVNNPVINMGICGVAGRQFK